MKKQKIALSDVPSVPDTNSKPTLYNEPNVTRNEDRIPEGGFKRVRNVSSRAELRLRVEELLMRREAPPNEAWLELGDDAREILLQLLDDVVITKREAMKQRLIATLGQLGVARAVPQLGKLLLRSTESAVTQTFAASALGRIGDSRVIPYLGQAITEKNEMVRRQVALALGRAHHPNAIPHLLKLLNDTSKHISSVAATELRQYEKDFNVKLGIKLKPSGEGNKEVKREPVKD